MSQLALPVPADQVATMLRVDFGVDFRVAELTVRNPADIASPVLDGDGLAFTFAWTATA